MIATLALESAGLSGFGARLKLRDDLFWFKKPEFLLSLIHFILFQVSISLSWKSYYMCESYFQSRLANSKMMAYLKDLFLNCLSAECI